MGELLALRCVINADKFIGGERKLFRGVGYVSRPAAAPSIVFSLIIFVFVGCWAEKTERDSRDCVFIIQENIRT